MKQSRSYTGVGSFGICILFGLFAVVSVGGEGPTEGKVVKSPETPAGRFDIQGAVVDGTWDVSSVLDTLESMPPKSQGEYLEALRGTSRPQPVRNLPVTLRGRSVLTKVVSDSEGKFRFAGLPAGDYEVSAELASRPTGLRGAVRTATAKERVRLGPSSRKVTLRLRTDTVAIRGRVTAMDGTPISGARVRGAYYPMPEAGEIARHYPSSFAVSGTDGSYELGGFVPQGIASIAGYLSGGDPTQNSQYPFFVDIHVDAAGSVQGKGKMPRVPLVTEELLGSARRLLKIYGRMGQTVGRPELQEKDGLHLPSSQGNTITGIDIVMEKMQDAKQTP